MNGFVKHAINQPITVAVGVVLALVGGILAFSAVPVQMTPHVDSVVISVSTLWENASAEEIESDIIEQQERVLGDLSGLVSMTSTSQAGNGSIRLEFRTGTNIKQALAEVDQKLSEVPSYPEGILEPVVEGVDPESVDYIAWIGLSSTDPEFDTTTLFDFMERRLRPNLERIPGVSQVGIRGARDKEIQIHFDPVLLAQRGITYAQLVDAIRFNNENFSGGRLESGKSDIRIRATGRFLDEEDVENLIITRQDGRPVYLRDLATVQIGYKEKTEWIRARGHEMPFFNFQLEQGANLIEVMDAIQAKIAEMNAPGGLLDQQAAKLGVKGKLELVQTYDSTTYVHDAISLVQSNVAVGGVLATLTLLLFLRSLRTVGIIAVAIPISIIASMVVLVALGRSINIISLAGLAFATGMVVDNAIVVIENIYRHLEMGKRPRQAALDGAQEVAGAVVASTITTVVVFLPILFIQETAGQLFRDIALAISAAVGLSLIVSITVIPAASGRFLGAVRQKMLHHDDVPHKPTLMDRIAKRASRVPDAIAWLVSFVSCTWPRRLGVIAVFAAVTIIGTSILIPPLDYLPRGNRNVVFGVMIPPPGYSVEQLSQVGHRIEDVIRPSWEVAGDRFGVESVVRGGPSTKPDNRTPVPLSFPEQGEVVPPALDHYFLVGWDGTIFQVAIAEESRRTVDSIDLLNAATSGTNAPDVISFAFQFPLFRTGGTTGSAIKIDLKGDDMPSVSAASGALFAKLAGKYSPYSITPSPANFALPSPELQITPDDARLRDLGMSRQDIGYAVQANGDGLLLVRNFELGGELKDIKIINPEAIEGTSLEHILETPIATPNGKVVDLASLADIQRIRNASEINHVDRRRAVTLQFTPPTELPLEDAIDDVNAFVEELRDAGAIPPSVEISLAGSAGALNEIKTALVGDGTLGGTLTSSLVLAIVVIYLVMVVLFQSWVYPAVILISVPLATFGGFLGLAAVHAWSVADRYMPVQNLDVLTILGFVILAGVVVNNAILLVHQSLNFLKEEHITPQQAVLESVKSRVRPILMSTLTSVGGMLPLVLMPGSGSELYRGLGAVVVGGLVVSTVFTLFLVPVVLSALFDLKVRATHEFDEVMEGEKASAPVTA